MSNRIEQIIGDISEYIDGCKGQAFSSTKIIVDRPTIEDYLSQLRQYTPEEVRKYQRMLGNREKILADARQKASQTEQEAREYAERLVSENSVTKMAYDKAKEILDEASAIADEKIETATREAREIRESALVYTDRLLAGLKSIIGGTLDDTRNSLDNLVSTLTNHYNIIVSNQNELLDSEGDSNYSAPKEEKQNDNSENDEEE